LLAPADDLIVEAWRDDEPGAGLNCMFGLTGVEDRARPDEEALLLSHDADGCLARRRAQRDLGAGQTGVGQRAGQRCCSRVVVDRQDGDDAHGGKLAEYVLGGGWAGCHVGDPAAAAGPSEPAGYSSRGTRSFDQADSTGATTRQASSASSPRIDKAAFPFSTSSRSWP